MKILIAALLLFFAAPAAAQTVTIMAYGDSLTEGRGLPREQAFPARLEEKLKAEGLDVRVINAGVTGETSAEALARLDAALAQHNPDYVILETGSNDMLRNLDPKVTRDSIRKILVRLGEKNIPVLLAGIRAFPRRGDLFGRRYNGLYEDLAEAHAKEFYPFFLKGVALEPQYNQPDGIHPNAAGVDVIVGNILPHVKNLIEKD